MTETIESLQAVPRKSAPRWALAALGVGVAIVFLAPSGTSSPPEGWGDDPQAAFDEAAGTSRRVVLGFYLPGCPPCAAMEHEVLPAKAVRTALDGFVPVLVNAITHPEFAERYQVEVTPTYIITDAQGNQLARSVGYQSVDEFVAFVRNVSK